MRRWVLIGASLAAACAVAGCRSREERTESAGERQAPAAEGPSVIVVIVDTLRADRLGCYGYSRATSPWLDAIAAESIVFENAYSQAPNTPPSIASILTSLYPHDHHFTGKGDRLSERALTVAESFGAAGYRTGAFVDAGFMTRQFGLDQGFEVYEDEGGGFEKILPIAARWVREASERPFFLLLLTYDVHTPYEQTPEPYRSRFVDPSYAGTFESKDLEKIRTRAIDHRLTPEETRHFSDLYDGGIAHADALLGSFLADLRKDGLLDRTVLAMTSDHGEEFMEHGSILHEKLYRTVTHVPLLVRLPLAKHRGSRIKEVVETIDIVPTLLAAAGIPRHAGMQGRDLLTLVRGEPFPHPRALGQLPWNQDLTGYYAGKLHMIADARTGAVELFDVVADPLEQNDVAASGAGIIATMKSDLAARLGEAASRAYIARSSANVVDGLDPKTEESLRALGYTD